MVEVRMAKSFNCGRFFRILSWCLKIAFSSNPVGVEIKFSFPSQLWCNLQETLYEVPVF